MRGTTRGDGWLYAVLSFASKQNMTICSWWGHLHITKSLFHKISVWLYNFKMKACGYLVHVCASSLCLCVRFHCLTTGGLNEFGVLHPSLCEVSVPSIKKSCLPTPRASTPGEPLGFWLTCHLWESFPGAPYLQLQPTISFSVSTKDLVVVMWPYIYYMYIDHVTMQLNISVASQLTSQLASA